MKKLIVLAALLVAASACTTTTNTNEGAANTNANANANAAATATPAGVSQADLEAKERQVGDAIKAKNWDTFGGFLSDDFTLVGRDGIYDKAKTLDYLKKYDLTEYTFSDIKFVKVDDDLGVLIYTSTEKSNYDGKPSPESDKTIYNASAWANRGGKWVGVFHQATEKIATMAGQDGNMNANVSPGGANKNANASGANVNTSASPSSSPAAPASVTDAEKAVWEAFKAKDSDAFASFLASDAME